MSQKSIKIFVDEIYSKPTKKKRPTNKNDVCHIDDIWSLNILNFRDYGPKNNRGYRHNLVVVDNFSNFG